jgi:hypothetical protein
MQPRNIECVDMLRTWHKERVGSELSYPVGAESISLALEGTRHGQQLTISFWRTRDIPPDEHIPVASVDYRPARRGRVPDDMAARGAVWSFMVKAVPRQHVRRVRELMKDVGLGRFADWLDQPRTPVWLDSRHSLSAVLDRGTSELRFIER